MAKPTFAERVQCQRGLHLNTVSWRDKRNPRRGAMETVGLKPLQFAKLPRWIGSLDERNRRDKVGTDKNRYMRFAKKVEKFACPKKNRTCTLHN